MRSISRNKGHKDLPCGWFGSTEAVLPGDVDTSAIANLFNLQLLHPFDIRISRIVEGVFNQPAAKSSGDVGDSIRDRVAGFKSEHAFDFLRIDMVRPVISRWRIFQFNSWIFERVLHH